jgi:hypothetical protein
MLRHLDLLVDLGLALDVSIVFRAVAAISVPVASARLGCALTAAPSRTEISSGSR